MDGKREAAFYALLRRKLIVPPWNYAAPNNTIWKVRINLLD